jgi:L-fuculose-phosphate aldolase
MSAASDAAQGPASDAELRAAVIDGCRELARRSLALGTSGNVSVRRDARSFFVSPSGRAYDTLQSLDVPLVDLESHWFGHCRPSSEWRFHRDIYRARAEVRAIVHTHSPKASALAATGRGIPAFHYMVSAGGGADIRCAAYQTFGTQALSDAVLTALAGRTACLIANHGVIALGRSLAAALQLAAQVEDLAAQYCTALAIGQVQILDEREMGRVLEKFRTYGQPDAPDEDLRLGGAELPRRED